MDFVGSRLRERAADWFVGLYNIGAPELKDVDAFMQALWHQFEDPLELEKAQTRLRGIR